MAGAPEDDYSDLAVLGINVLQAEEDALAKKFDKCVKHIQAVAASLDDATLLRLYGLYKQSLEGTCNTPKPNWYDLKGKSKWEAWKLLGDLDQDQAKAGYIELTLSSCPGFSWDSPGDKAPSWVAVSAPVAQHDPLRLTISDHIRNGDLAKVASYLERTSGEKNQLDGNGMGLIHYAADIGDTGILEMLLRSGCEVNLQDSEGQTALHYAASCGHFECVQLLLDHSADISVRDAGGASALESAVDGRVRDLLAV